MKKVALILAIVIFSLFTIPAFATGDPNADGGGGGMGGGTGGNFWNPGNDGVRVSIVKVDTGTTIGASIDYTNAVLPTSIIYFGNKAKLQYLNGSKLSINISDKYLPKKPTQPLPPIISDSGASNIEAIKSYFCSEYVIHMIATDFGMNYDNLISGKFKLLLEPIAYFKFEGNNVGMTATEAALYDKQLDGGLRGKMLSLSHQNLPFSMFLEREDFGIAPWNGSTSSPVDNDTIIHKLGIGVISFGEQPPVTDTWDYTYTCDTDVITSVNLSSGKDPIGVDYVTDHADWDGSPIAKTGGGASVSFEILGGVYRVDKIYMPSYSSQLVWVKWHTPKEPAEIEIKVTSGGGELASGVIKANIVEVVEVTPPDPTAAKAEQVKDFPIPTTYDNVQDAAFKSDSWSIWTCYWRYDWQWEIVGYEPIYGWVTDEECTSSGPDHRTSNSGKHQCREVIAYKEIWDWVDHGGYVFGHDNYDITLKGMTALTPDSLVPTARGKTMKSGYGVNIATSYHVTEGSFSMGMVGLTPYTSVTFPEFNYADFNRILTRGATENFKLNKYSTYNKPVHFTPLWYSDGVYRVLANMFAIWTPNGEITLQTTDYMDIYGNLYDDYYVHLVEE